MDNLSSDPALLVAFFRTEAGTEPVRDWLRAMTVEDRKAIGTDIKTVQFGWTLGMPLVRKMEPDLWEVAATLPMALRARCSPSRMGG
jgi:phage-related protein